MAYNSLNPLNELSLTMNPTYAFYNNTRPSAGAIIDETYFSIPQTTLTTPLLTTSTQSNIYTRIPAHRSFTPYDTKMSPSNYVVTLPLILQIDSNDHEKS